MILTLKTVDVRSSGDLNACYSVIEAIGPQTRDVLITNLHLTALKVCTLIQADLMILAILCKNNNRFVKFIYNFCTPGRFFRSKKAAVFLMCIILKLLF